MMTCTTPVRHTVSGEHGYALYLVLVILSAVVIVLSITSAGLRRTIIFVQKEVRRSQAALLAESGIVRAEYFLNGGDGHSVDWETDGYEERVDEFGLIGLVVERFGFYSRLVATGKRKTTNYSIACCFGRTVPSLCDQSLTLTGHVGGLILHNGSRVDDRIILHHGYVYTKKNGPPLPEYTSRLSFRDSPRLPFDSSEIHAVFERCLKKRTQLLENTKAVSGTLALDGKSFGTLKDTLFIINGDCTIRAGSYEGVTIAASGVCIIEQEAVLHSCACYAEKMVIDGGTTAISLFFSERNVEINRGNHKSQFIALDSIITSSAALFNNGTVLAAMRHKVPGDSTDAVNGGIYIEGKSVIQGTILCCDPPGVDRKSNAPSVVIGDGSSITGTVVTDGDVRFCKSRLQGRLWAKAIVALYEGQNYTNYLIESTITKENDNVPFPLLGETPLKIKKVTTK